MHSGDISVYSGYTPDTIHDDHPDGSGTFFYVPASDHFYLQPFPTIHRNMLSDDDDVFEDVYADYLKGKKVNDQLRSHLSSRGQALENGRAILGRIGLDGSTPLIALWSTKSLQLDQNMMRSFLDALYKKLPAFKQFQGKTVVSLPGKQPVLASSFLGYDPERQVAKVAQMTARKPKTKPDATKSYMIDGRNYSISDLQAMRSAVHTQGYTNPALCHPDMKQYPELQGFIPNCGQAPGNLRKTAPQNWRQAAQAAGIPNVYSHEGDESFKNWLKISESLRIS